jgi:hypothetical protein
MKKPTKTQYRAKNGETQWKPSIELAMALNDMGSGFCLACAAEPDGVEPDARRYTCPECGAAKVYGGEELVLMGLVF